MPVIGRRELLRRAALLWCGLGLLRAEQKPPLLDVLAKFADYISQSNSSGALSYVSPDMPGYHAFEANLTALLAQNDVLCSIEVRNEDGDEQTRRAETDWYVQVKSKEENGPTERRQEVVKITIAKQGKNWKIVALEPASVLQPPKV